MNKDRVFILAAGKGTRMESDLPKVLHKVNNIPMVNLVLKAANFIDEKPVLIVGYQKEKVILATKGLADYAVQKELKGTGSAVMAANEYIPDHGYIIIVAGDMPLLKGSTIKKLVKETKKGNWAAGILTAVVDDATGYGRIIKDESGRVLKIVEHKDATEIELKTNEINTSVYCFKAKKLKYALTQINCNNSQGEYYLTDTIGVLVKESEKVATVSCSIKEAMGINTKEQLNEAEKHLQNNDY